MRISFLFFLILIVLVLLAFRGRRIGFFGIIAGIVAWVFTILFTAFGNDLIKAAIIRFTGLNDYLKNYFHSRATITDEFAGNMADSVIKVIAIIVTFAIAWSIAGVMKRWANKVNREENFISGSSRLLGIIWGLAEGVLLSWVILAACQTIIEGNNQSELFLDIKGNYLLSFLENNNPLYYLIK